MKKSALFLIIFLLLSALTAEEVSTEQNDSTGINAEHATQVKEDKPKKFYFAPSIGMRTGIGITAVADTDFDFLVCTTARKNNIYLGLSGGFRYTSKLYDLHADKENFFEVPLRVNIVFDFKQHNQYVAYLSFWLSGGAELMWWKEKEYVKVYNEETSKYHYEKSVKSVMSATGAYGIGFDIVFRANAVLKFWIDSWELIYPEFAVAVGYRF